MPEVTRTVIVAHTPDRMFRLIDAVEAYPEFLPWCGSATVLHRDDAVTRATLHINFHGIRQSFTTENAKKPPQEMLIRLVDGPFRSLEGAWRLTALGAAGCKIEFHMSYEFSSRLLEKIVGPVFDHIAGSLVDAFVRRADGTAETRD
jgi:ribosome-associated toxin RatA of RatAB toxin-antitoxin module